MSKFQFRQQSPYLYPFLLHEQHAYCCEAAVSIWSQYTRCPVVANANTGQRKTSITAIDTKNQIYKWYRTRQVESFIIVRNCTSVLYKKYSFRLANSSKAEQIIHRWSEQMMVQIHLCQLKNIIERK